MMTSTSLGSTVACVVEVKKEMINVKTCSANADMRCIVKRAEPRAVAIKSSKHVFSMNTRNEETSFELV